MQPTCKIVGVVTYLVGLHGHWVVFSGRDGIFLVVAALRTVWCHTLMGSSVCDIVTAISQRGSCGTHLDKVKVIFIRVATVDRAPTFCL